jgi:hypothetical protein
MNNRHLSQFLSTIYRGESPPLAVKQVARFFRLNGRHLRSSTMLLPTDFWRAARYLISRYGAEAGERARLRANELHEAGETGLHNIWSVLAATVAEIDSAGNVTPLSGARETAMPERAN